MSGYVYILASQKMGTLYVGVTNDLARRIYEHKNNINQGFTKKYSVHLLVWYENFESIDQAIEYEKRVKRWRRDWKIDLIEKNNPLWNDLYNELI